MADRCRSCDAQIEWATTATTGKAIPLDVEPAADGNLVLIDGRVHSARDAAPELPRRKSHFATCPQAGAWRKRR